MQIKGKLILMVVAQLRATLFRTHYWYRLLKFEMCGRKTTQKYDGGGNPALDSSDIH